MKIDKYIKLNGKEFPMVSTPISGNERIFLEENFDRYFIYDVNNGTIKNNTSIREFKRYKIDFGYKPIITIFACMFGVYKYYSIKKKIKNIKPKIPKAKVPEGWTETMNGWSIREDEAKA